MQEMEKLGKEITEFMTEVYKPKTGPERADGDQLFTMY